MDADAIEVLTSRIENDIKHHAARRLTVPLPPLLAEDEHSVPGSVRLSEGACKISIAVLKQHIATFKSHIDTLESVLASNESEGSQLAQVLEQLHKERDRLKDGKRTAPPAEEADPKKAKPNGPAPTVAPAHPKK
jgi:hypothetical protein